MKKSDMFQKIYRNISEINESIGEAYNSDTIFPEIDDEALDLSIPENTVEFMKTVLHFYSQRLSRELAASFTETLSNFLKMEDDVNLFNPEAVEELISAVEE